MPGHQTANAFSQAIISSILFVMGFILLFLVFTPLYYYYLIPSFRVLSVIAALLLITSGVVSILFRVSYIKTTTVFIYIVTFFAVTYSVTMTMALAASARNNLANFDAAVPKEDLEEGSERDLQSAQRPDVTPEEGYMPISIPELYLMVGENAPSYIFEDLTFRGRLVYLDYLYGGEGGYLLSRPAMPCCAADTVQVFIPVQMPDEFLEEDFQRLQWVAVSGRLAKKASEIDEERLAGIITDTVTAFNVVETDYIFKAEKIKPSEPPRRPYVTMFTVKPPFDY